MPHNSLVKLSLLGFTKSLVLANDANNTKNWGTFSDVVQVFEGGLTEDNYKCAVAADGYGYVGSDTSTPIVRKIDLSTMDGIGVVPNTAYKYYKLAAVDDTGKKGVFSTLDPGKTKKSAVVVIELETMKTMAITEHDDADGFTSAVTADNHVLYGTAGSPAKVYSFDMGTQEFESGSFTGDSGEDDFKVSISDGTNAYFVPDGARKIVKIKVSDLSREGAVEVSGSSGEEIVSGVYQKTGNFGYFGTSAGRVIKVDLTALTVAKTVDATSADGTFGPTAVNYNDKVYFTTATRIVQYDVTDETPSRVGHIANPATNVEAVMLQVVDSQTVSPYAYYVGNSAPGSVHRVSLSTTASVLIPAPTTTSGTTPTTSGSREVTSSGCDDTARLSFFNSLDTDNNNKLTAEEVENQFEKLNVPDGNASKLAEKLVLQEDKDETNSLECAEFTEDVSRVLKEPTAAQAAACADANDDGLVSQEEYYDYMGSQATGLDGTTANAAQFSRLTESDEAEQFHLYDTNNDGLLNEDEFQEYLTGYTYLGGVSTDEASQEQVDTVMGAAPTDEGFISSLISKGSSIVGRTDGKLVPFCSFHKLRPGSWQQDFIRSDTSNNGRISRIEHRSAVAPTATDAQIDTLIAGGDSNGDNVLDFPEYRRLRQLGPESLQREFIDADGTDGCTVPSGRNGKIENDELRAKWATRDAAITGEETADLMVDSGDLDAEGLNYPQYVNAREALITADDDNDGSITSSEYDRYRETQSRTSNRGVLDKEPCYVGKLRCWLFGVIVAGLVLFCCALFLCLVCCRSCCRGQRERETHTSEQEHNPLAASKVLTTEVFREEKTHQKVVHVPTAETTVQEQRGVVSSETRGRVTIMTEEMQDRYDMQIGSQKDFVEMQGRSAEKAAEERTPVVEEAAAPPAPPLPIVAAPEEEEEEEEEAESSVVGIQADGMGEIYQPSADIDAPLGVKTEKEAFGMLFNVVDGEGCDPTATSEQNIVILRNDGRSIAADWDDPTVPITMKPQLNQDDPHIPCRGWEVIYDDDWVWIRSVRHRQWLCRGDDNILKLKQQKDETCKFFLRVVDALPNRSVED